MEDELDKYYLKADWQNDWQEVTKEEWIKAERQAGFGPKGVCSDEAYMKICATGGFSGSGFKGKVIHV